MKETTIFNTAIAKVKLAAYNFKKIDQYSV